MRSKIFTFGSLLASAALSASLAVACSTTADQPRPACTNASSAIPYGDAGVLPIRSLPTGFPCGTDALCVATIDDCASDWPASSATPSTTNATPFLCTCPSGIWTCAAESSDVPVCTVTGTPGTASDAGLDGGGD